jgi:hypothetical protein
MEQALKRIKEEGNAVPYVGVDQYRDKVPQHSNGMDQSKPMFRELPFCIIVAQLNREESKREKIIESIKSQKYGKYKVNIM